ncbi:MAG: hypothetical protein AAF732_19365 [Pseudomonadota bacterium]
MRPALQTDLAIANWNKPECRTACLDISSGQLRFYQAYEFFGSRFLRYVFAQLGNVIALHKIVTHDRDMNDSAKVIAQIILDTG